MKVVFYTIDCPKCRVLENKLKTKMVVFEECRDIEIMQEKGFENAPMLEVDGTAMSFGEAVKWINNLEA
jgi:hypothetical protein